MKRKELVGMLLAGSLLSGCATSEFNSNTIRMTDYQHQNGYTLGASLVETDTGWRFKDIIEEGGEVSLGYFSYRGTTDTKSCWRSFFGITDGDCHRRHLKFHDDSPNLSSNIFIPLQWAIGTPLSILFSPFNSEFLEYIFPIAVDREFGWDDYSDAINEAKVAEGYDNRFPELYSRYAQLSQSVNTQLHPEPETNLEPLKKESITFKSAMSQKLMQKAISQLSIKVTDKSGLVSTGKIKNQLKQTLDTSVQLANEPIFTKGSYTTYLNESNVLKDIFPAKSLDDWSSRLNIGMSELNKIKTNNKKIKSQNQKVFSQINANNASKLKKYQAELSEENGDIYVKKSRRTNYLLDNLNYDLEVPINLKIEQGKLTKNAIVELTIKGRNYTNILPESYENKNKEIEVSLDGQTLTLTNKTDKYITLDALSLYHNTNVLTRGGDNFQNFSELAPGTERQVSLNEFNLDSLTKDYHDLTKQKASKTNIVFGFAIKYRITELDAPRTLYKKTNYNLYKILAES
jgi:hypothetical protein